MAQYIDKDDLLVEIERLREVKPLDAFQPKEQNKIDWLAGKLFTITSLEVFLNTSEGKEVDLERALSDLDKDIKEFITTGEFERESKASGHYWAIAKHAFLLGLKVQKGE